MGTSRRPCKCRDSELFHLWGEVIQVYVNQLPSVTGEGQPWGHFIPQFLRLSCLGRADPEAGEGLSKEVQMLDPGPGMGSLGHPLILTQKLEFLFHHLQSRDNATCLSPCCEHTVT